MKRTLLVFSVVFVAASLAASFFPRGGMWGLDAWAALSPYLALALAIAVVPQFFRKVGLDPFRLVSVPGRGALRAVAVAAASACVFWLLRARHDLWGERLALAEALERGILLPESPIASFIHATAYRFLNGVFLWSAADVVALFGVAAGTLFVLFSSRAAGLLFEEEGERGLRALAAAAIVANGSTVLFLGGGNTALAALLALAFLVSSVEFLRGRRTIALALFLLFAAVRSHSSAAYLVPAGAYLAAIGISRPGSRRGTVLELAALALAWIAFEVVLSARVGTTPLRSVFAWMRGGADCPPFPCAALGAANALLIIGPSSVAALALIFGGGRAAGRESDGEARERRFLVVAALSAAAIVVAAGRATDGGLGWDLAGAAGPAFALCALRLLRGRCADSVEARSAVSMLVLLGAFHAAPLVVLNATTRLAEKRVLAAPLAAGRAEMIIADRALADGDDAKARRWYLASLEKNRANALASARLGRIEMRKEEYAAAITRFLDAHELAPDDPRYRFELADALTENRWFPEAIAHLETLVTAHPESVAFWRRLGFARNNSNHYEGAVAAYEQALALEPRKEQNVLNLVSALLNRAAELQAERRFDEARSHYDRAIGYYPRDWRAYNNIAVMEMNLGNYGKAYELLEGSLKLHPYEPTLHTNMGLVLEKLGRKREALEHLRKSAELDPLYSKAPPHVERLERELGIEAQPDSQRSPLNNP